MAEKSTDETWLLEFQRQALTPNRYIDGDPHVAPLEAIVLHYTASRSFMGTLRWLRMTKEAAQAAVDAQAKRKGIKPGVAAVASAHFLIDRDGSMFQLAPLEDRTWHAGGATSKLEGKSNVNGRTLGIELMNIGPLRAVTDPRGTPSFIAVVDKKPWEESGVQAHDGTFWEPFATAQIDTLVGLLDRIYEKHPGLREAKRLIDHHAVDPSRKTDVGPAFPWTVLRSRLGL